MTEDEAKTKWCPHIRYTPPTQESGWSWNSNDPCGQPMCIGSACMAWRWVEPPSDWLAHATVEQREAYRPHGYCGLAGKP